MDQQLDAVFSSFEGRRDELIPILQDVQTEFGYRGSKPHNLIGPRYLGLDTKGRLYVSQLRNRGISVFKIMIDTNTKGTSTRKKRR